jgi:hypothetical protein
MPTYRVKVGALLPHAGTVYEAGAVVTLPRAVASELPHLVEEIDAAGQVVPARAAWELEAERFRQHEQVGVLQRAKAEHQLKLVDAQAIAHRERQAADASAAAVQSLLDTIAQIDAAIAEAQHVEIEGVSAPPAQEPAQSSEPDVPATKSKKRTGTAPGL